MMTRIPYGFAHDAALACEKEGPVYERIAAALCRPGVRSGRALYLDLSDEERAELREEASFRVETYGDTGENAHLITSARAMIRSLNEQEVKS